MALTLRYTFAHQPLLPTLPPLPTRLIQRDQVHYKVERHQEGRDQTEREGDHEGRGRCSSQDAQRAL